MPDRDAGRSEHRSDRIIDYLWYRRRVWLHRNAVPSRRKRNRLVTKEIRYITADEEELLIIAQANEPLDEEGHFINAKVAARGVGGEIAMFPKRSGRYDGRIAKAGSVRGDSHDSIPGKRRR